MAFGAGSRRWLVLLLLAAGVFWQTGSAWSQSKLSPGYAAGDAGLSPSERAGREIWFYATAFNDRFYTYSYPQRLGAAIDWYLVLAAKNKGDLFQAWGAIPDPDCCVPGVGTCEAKSLDEIARFLNGLALQKYPPSHGRSLPLIKIAQLRAGHTSDADRASADLDADYIVEDGDLLFSWSGSLECVLWAGDRGALNQHLFKVTSAGYPKWLCYLGVHRHLGDFRHIAAGKATTMGHIQRHHLSDAKLAVPSQLLVRALDAVIAPLVESLWRRSVESRSLATLRDSLLPKLISGELRLKNVEESLEEAT